MKPPSAPGAAPELPHPSEHEDFARDREGHLFGVEGSNKTLPQPSDAPLPVEQHPLASEHKHVEPTPFLR